MRRCYVGNSGDCTKTGTVLVFGKSAPARAHCSVSRRETVTELQGGEPVGRVLEDAYVCDLADVSALEIGDGTLAVAYKGGQRNEFELHEGTAVEIGDQAVPVENLLELRVAS
jgi:hypothetical protein